MNNSNSNDSFYAKSLAYWHHNLIIDVAHTVASLPLTIVIINCTVPAAGLT